MFTVQSSAVFEKKSLHFQKEPYVKEKAEANQFATIKQLKQLAKFVLKQFVYRF